MATVRGVPEPLASCSTRTDGHGGDNAASGTSDSLAAQGRSQSSFTSITNRLTISTHLSPERLNETDEIDGTAFQVSISDMFDFQNSGLQGLVNAWSDGGNGTP